MKRVWLGASALVCLASAQFAAAQPATRPTSSTVTLEEVVVTAQKVTERLNDVPASVTALSGSLLGDAGLRSVVDFGALVPGLTTVASGSGATTLVLRGINTGGTQTGALVGVLVDGVPSGSSTAFAGAGVISLDSALWDADRVEVLRGPQGTLYGANGMAGLLSYIYRNPNLTDYEARGEAEGSASEKGGRNYAVRAAVSTPIIANELAFRLAASHEDTSGFIDNPALGKDDINRGRSDNVRGTLLFKPQDDWTIRLSGLYQKTKRDANDYALYDRASGEPASGELSITAPLLDPAEFKYSQGALTVDYDLGGASLTSISGYQRTDVSITNDYTNTAFGPLLGFFGAAAVNAVVTPATNKFTQELRLASTGERAFRYLAGVFFTNENSDNGFALNGFLPNGVPFPPLSPALAIAQPSHYREYAAFAQGTYSVTTRLDLAAGFRYSHDSQSFSAVSGGPLGAVLPNLPPTSSTENEENYLFDARYEVTPASNLYVRAASGYRPGGPNLVVPGAPTAFAPDRLWNYEAGYKGTLLDGRADVQANVFYISWRDIQLPSAAAGIPFTTNGSGASSKGIELQGAFIPFQGMTMGANVAYTEARLEDPALSVGGVDGERLPNSPHWSGALLGDYHFPVSASWKGFVGGTVRAVGERTSSFNANPANPQFILESYVTGDLRAGVDNDRWTLTAFVRNVADKRAELSALTSTETTTGDALVQVARPRTFGLTLDVHL